ncbi:D-threo-aldose 1-dehydrogenase [Arthrobacter sp. Hiyo1]|uniref:aldo/keto reductase n=1 Tax=Arthrobacter sp. Hiyo1 TaxID=1588020 RepID=UPI0006A3249E|nr:aldo/keto reductase [Arthrobacter sp. Hiyo1]GAP60613.1 D-threo-aldose 1-dehydrogenase [Arthrobacter sp. Hiyo1]
MKPQEHPRLGAQDILSNPLRGEPTSRVRLGGSLQRISQLGLGAGTQSNVNGAAALDAILEHAWGIGLRYFDTAPLYLAGESERRLGAFLGRHKRSDYVVSSKVGRLPNITNPNEFGGLRQFDYSAGGTRASIEASLERLGLDRIDFVVIHDLDRKMHGIEFDAVYAQAMDECFPVLDGLRTEGVIGSIGISAADTRVCLQAARDAPLDALMMAGSYTLLNHEPLTELLPYCLEKGVSVVIASPFNSGILATGSTDSMYDYGKPTADILSRVLELVEVGSRHGVALATAALQFPLLHPAVASVVVGHRSSEELDGNVAAMRTSIPPAFWAELKERDLIPDEAPVNAENSA